MPKALNKVHKINDVLVKEGLREDLQVSELKGVVLLPNIVNIRLENEEIISETITVTGAKARSSQASSWARPPSSILGQSWRI